MERRGSSRVRQAVVVLSLVTAAACGEAAPQYDVTPVTTTSTILRPSVSEAPAVVSGVTGSGVSGSGASGTGATVTRPPVIDPWVPATANLAGLASECGNISFVSARPDRDVLTVSVALRGLWSSQSGSASWTALGQSPGSAAITNRGSSIVYDPDRPNTYWVSGTYNAGGVYRTDDNGATFRQLGGLVHSDGVGVDLTDPQRRTLVSGTHEQSKVYVSRDGGDHWTLTSGVLPAGTALGSLPLVFGPQTYLVGAYGGDSSTILRTIDGGVTWVAVFRGPVQGLPLVAKSDGSIYWITGSGGIIRSTDKGVTWVTVTSAGRVFASAPFLVELPDGQIAAASRTLIVSADHGANWRAVGPALPYTPNGVAYSSFRKSFYIWRFTCDQGQPNPVPADAIMSLKFDYTNQ